MKNGIMVMGESMNELNNITVTEILDISTVISEKGVRYSMIRRPAMGLSFCKSGKIIYRHNGQEFISDKNCAIILPMGASYELARTEAGQFPLINFFCKGFSPETFTVIKLQNPESYIRDFEKMKTLSLFDNNRPAVMSIFYDVINRLCNEEKAEYDILTPAFDYIENNYSDNAINNCFLSELCGISEVYFRKLFAAGRGISPRQYILEVRIRHAKHLLTDTDMTVGEISEQIGFSSVYHFCRAFKNRTGMTPSEYSRQNAPRGI